MQLEVSYTMLASLENVGMKLLKGCCFFLPFKLYDDPRRFTLFASNKSSQKTCSWCFSFVHSQDRSSELYRWAPKRNPRNAWSEASVMIRVWQVQRANWRVFPAKYQFSCLYICTFMWKLDTYIIWIKPSSIRFFPWLCCFWNMFAYWMFFFL